MKEILKLSKDFPINKFDGIFLFNIQIFTSF